MTSNFIAKIRSLFHEGRFDEIAMNVRTAPDDLDSDYDSCKFVGISFYQTGDLTQSEQWLSKAFSLNPELAESNYVMGFIYEAKGDDQKALQHLKTAIKIDPAFVDAHFNLGVLYYKLSKWDLAIDVFQRVIDMRSNDYAAFNYLGSALNQCEKADAAIEAYESALKINPRFAAARSNIAALYFDLKRYDDAARYFELAVDDDPSDRDAVKNLAISYMEGDNHEKALPIFNQLIESQPADPEPYHYLGLISHRQNEFLSAVTNYRKAIALQSDFAQAHFNLGILLIENGDLTAAIVCLQKLCSFDLQNFRAFHNLGVAHYRIGNLGEAVDAFVRAITLNNNYEEAFRSLGLLLSRVRFSRARPDLLRICQHFLDDKNYVPVREISASLISLIKHETSVSTFLGDCPLGVNNVDELITLTQMLDQTPALKCLMELCPLCDPELEQLFTTARKFMCLNYSDLPDLDGLAQLQETLAVHCFINEYVFSSTAKELETIEELIAYVATEVGAHRTPEKGLLLCIAAYHPLSDFAWSDALSSIELGEKVHKHLIDEPRVEQSIQKNIVRPSPVADRVSLEVQAQYEANPYPRWIKPGFDSTPKSVEQVFKEALLRKRDFDPSRTEQLEILVAGCGTGHHAISTAKRFHKCKVTAIDLSSASLAYAIRKASELQIQNIRFLQLDILDCAKLNNTFDVIECVGVLHHMADPVAGWRALRRTLKPDGLMKIGLYSKLARRNITSVRNRIERLGIGASKEEIVSFRQTVLTGENSWKDLIESRDFYSVSEVRDLIFHAMEHQFSIDQWSSILSRLELEFCGFENNDLVNRFMRDNSGHCDIYDLNSWQRYEAENPHIFLAMYQFWCQAKAARNISPKRPSGKV